MVGEIVKKIASNMGRRVPQALNTVKNDNSKNARLTNWNFIWYNFPHAGSPSTESGSKWTRASRTSSWVENRP